MLAATAFKILTAQQWSDWKDAGVLHGAPIDLQDGFIHLSTTAQVRGTAARHFTGEDGLLLVGVDPQRLGAALRYEPSRGGALFPHLYAPLCLEAVISVKPLPLGTDGLHQFDDSFP